MLMKRDFVKNKGEAPQVRKVETRTNISMLVLIGLLLSLTALLPNCVPPVRRIVDVKPSGRSYGDKVPLKVGYYITTKFENYSVRLHGVYDISSGFAGLYYPNLGLATGKEFGLALVQLFAKVEAIYEEYPYTRERAKEVDVVIEPQIDKFYFHDPTFKQGVWRAGITYKITLYDSNWNILFTRSVEGVGNSKGRMSDSYSENASIAASKAIQEGVKNAMDTILTSEEIEKLLRR